ncbi:efflux RND transporter periplasmic adaptor subunit [Paenarthrobacter sp. OM7]|uniref:efflux RND transporter periplasmic adaptor subunit n=1 Tax=Paenarthrobacter sp. OM7 TaxID=3041264 RepID=UPI00246971D6|nr:efflux RND transporter periplasmic adaptor subunit [Paenarthrobacter sp. OM7]WGM21772.1 efflux RND transporter periplasmic adaptor subunit [Paenarthrobacter sp. OM7]
MGIFRRVILPVSWLLVFAVIAVALVKIAFVDGLEASGSEPAPLAQVDIPVVPATRATVTNTVQIKGTVQSDVADTVRSTSAGKVIKIFVEEGGTVAEGQALFQVKAERPVTTPQLSKDGTPTTPKPVYDYFDILAPSAGTLQQLTTLIDQQVTVGEAVGKIDPGTYTVAGSVTAAQQYRLLGKPGPAEIALVGGPAPFQCAEVTLKNNASDDGGSASGGLAATGGGAGMGVGAAIAGPGAGGSQPEEGGTPTGTLSCAVPSDQQVFAGLGATMTVSAGVAPDVVTVPLTSVKGSVKDGIVWIAGPGGTGAAPEQRTVQLGLNDGNVVEVTSGLAEGEQVLEFVPGAPAAPGPMMGPGQVAYAPAG